jgi:hypothetical protein
MKQWIHDHNSALEDGEREVCNLHAHTIERKLPEAGRGRPSTQTPRKRPTCSDSNVCAARRLLEGRS